MDKTNKKYLVFFLLLLVLSFIVLFFPWGRRIGIIASIASYVGIVIIMMDLQYKFSQWRSKE